MEEIIKAFQGYCPYCHDGSIYLENEYKREWITKEGFQKEIEITYQCPQCKILVKEDELIPF